MRMSRIAISSALATTLVLPLSGAQAQYYPTCPPFPLFWPFCIAGAVVGTAAAVVTAPVRALVPPPYYPPPYGPPPYAPPPYAGLPFALPPPYYGPPR